jgi:hypothetical protein
MPDDNQEEKIKQMVEEVVHQEMAKEKKPTDNLKADQVYMKVAVDCSNAHNIAMQTMHYSESMGGNFTDPENLNVLQDCIELCEIMNSFILRQSRLKSDLAELCFHACNACVKLAEKFPDEPQMKALLQYCKIASESVRKIK